MSGRYIHFSPAGVASPQMGGMRTSNTLADHDNSRYLTELLAERQKLGPFMQVLPNCSRLLNQDLQAGVMLQGEGLVSITSIGASALARGPPLFTPTGRIGVNSLEHNQLHQLGSLRPRQYMRDKEEKEDSPEEELEAREPEHQETQGRDAQEEITEDKGVSKKIINIGNWYEKLNDEIHKQWRMTKENQTCKLVEDDHEGDILDSALTIQINIDAMLKHNVEVNLPKMSELTSTKDSMVDGVSMEFRVGDNTKLQRSVNNMLAQARTAKINNVVTYGLGRDLKLRPWEKGMEFDPLRQHRCFCPWVTPHVIVGTSGRDESTGLCGWWLTIDASDQCNAQDSHYPFEKNSHRFSLLKDSSNLAVVCIFTPQWITKTRTQAEVLTTSGSPNGLQGLL
eukprot:Gb_31616 [translate_table: standard]